jgi:hypothetical protein
MNEREWLVCPDPQPMLKSLQGDSKERKLRLFACACARRVRGKERTVSDEEILLGERFADGGASRKELRGAKSQIGGMGAYSAATANDICGVILDDDATKAAVAGASCAARFAAQWMYESTAVNFVGDKVKTEAAHFAEKQELANLARDIFGNPVHPVQIDPAWLARQDGGIIKLAWRIYGEHAFADLPKLADVLEEAGCTNAELLAHCRQPGPHVRGCWAVDLLLGKN